MITDKQEVPRSAQARYTVDNTDWLKAVAIVLVAVDHFAYFFVEEADWWSVFGRLAAPVFFFLLGYAQTRSVPLRWIGIGTVLTLLESWNMEWTWVTPNILFSLAVIRVTRPLVQNMLQQHGWGAFALLVVALIAALPIAANLVDYGAEGWLWALFGLCQRSFVDSRTTTAKNRAAQISATDAETSIRNVGLMRVVACCIAAVVYLWQEQQEFAFSQIQCFVFAFCLAILSFSLCLYARGPSLIQPPRLPASILRFVGRHTLEIYAIQLGGSELVAKLIPDIVV